MKVQKTNPSFGSLPIYKAKLTQPFFLRPFLRAKDVFISELDSTDIPRLGKAYDDYWYQTRFGPRIISEFEYAFSEPFRTMKKPERFFVVESAEPLPEKRKIKALALAEIHKDHIKLQLLQSQRETRKCFSQGGAGSCLLYVISRAANLLGKNSVELASAKQAIDFYKSQCGFKERITHRCTNFFLDRKRMPVFGQDVAQRYSIKPLVKEENFFC